jgi:hypothetical protein
MYLQKGPSIAPTAGMRLGARTGLPLLAIVSSTVLARAAHAAPEAAPSGSPSATSAPGLTLRPHSDPADVELANSPEISDRQAATGVVAALALGFGSGQAVEGRWKDTGWIFTFGESLSLVFVASSAVDSFRQCAFFPGQACPSAERALIGGLIAMGAFRLGEIVDAAVAPGLHNRGVRDARRRLGWASAPHVAPYVAPTSHGSTVGLTMSF